VRPFGVSLLVAGFDDDGPQLYQVSADGTAAMGVCVQDEEGLPTEGPLMLMHLHPAARCISHLCAGGSLRLVLGVEGIRHRQELYQRKDVPGEAVSPRA